jgi:hypothetical protein
MQQLLECEIMSRSSRNAQIIIAIPLGLVGGYLLINMVNGLAHQRLFMKGFLGFGIFIFILAIIAEVLIWYYTRGKLTITKSPDNTLEIDIRFPSGSSESDKGKWDCEGIYVKEYAKYGMYKKHLGLNLSCNGKPACLLRHELGGFASDPEHFREVNTLYNLGGTEYWCKKVLNIEELISKENS